MLGPRKIYIISILVIIFSTFTVGAQFPEKRLCDYDGPYNTYDKKFKLTDLFINGTSKVFPGDKLYPGDKIKAGFRITNLKKEYIYIDDNKGLFFTAKDPEGDVFDFGNSHTGKKLGKRGRLDLKTEIALDVPGTWEIWPSFCYEVGNRTECTPQRLYTCYVFVSGTSKDTDGDGISDHKDNCPFVNNPGQEDSDEDGKGNSCDPCDDRDSDGDGIKNCLDKCPNEKETPANSNDKDGCPGTAGQSTNGGSGGYCGDGVCRPPENSKSCPLDCPIGGRDALCDFKRDNICDPDCESGKDPDCIITDQEYGIKYGGEVIFLSGHMRPGGFVQIPINLQADRAIKRLELDLRYQPEVLQAQEVLKGSLTADSRFSQDLNSKAGTIRVSILEDKGLRGEGSVAYVKFKVLGDAGKGSLLEIEKVFATNLDDAFLSMDTSRGFFVAEEPAQMMGDCNGDRRITAVDSLIALKMSRRVLPFDIIADMNNDGDITESDYLEILKLSLNETARF